MGDMTASVGRADNHSGWGPIVMQRANSRNHAVDLLYQIAFRHMRLGITGGPGTGKTTLSGSVAIEVSAWVLSTDDFKEQDWASQKASAYREFIRWQEAYPGMRCIMEGVTAARCAKMKPEPFSALVVLQGKDRVGETPGRKNLGKQITNWVGAVDLPTYYIHLAY